MKAIDTSPNFSAALKLLLFLKKKKIYFLWLHGDWPIKRQWGLRSWLDSPVEHFVTLWNDPMWRFIILITINIYMKREITFICGYYREELIWLIKSLVMFAHLVLIRKWSLCWSFSVSHYLMVQYEKRYEKYMKTIALYCTVMMKNNYVVSILTGPDTLQLCIQV